MGQTLLGNCIKGTRSAIGVVTGDGSIRAVYCHYDGYLDGVGKTLLENYKDFESIMDLVSFGDMSSLGTSIGEKHDFNRINISAEEKERTKDWCMFYNRDRGESDVSFGTFQNEEDFFDHYIGCGCEYLYLFEHATAEWYYNTDTCSPSDWELLNAALATRLADGCPGVSADMLP